MGAIRDCAQALELDAGWSSMGEGGRGLKKQGGGLCRKKKSERRGGGKGWGVRGAGAASLGSPGRCSSFSYLQGLASRKVVRESGLQVPECSAMPPVREGCCRGGAVSGGPEGQWKGEAVRRGAV